MAKHSSFILSASKKNPDTGYPPETDEELQHVLVTFVKDNPSPGETTLEITIECLGDQSRREQWGATHKAGSSVGSSGTVKLSNGAIFLPDGLKGRGIGTWVMNEIVKWAQHWPQATLVPITLSPIQATSDNQVRRNKFYSQFGVEFADTVESGRSSSGMKVADLQTVSCPPNIDVKRTEEKVRELLVELKDKQQKIVLKSDLVARSEDLRKTEARSCNRRLVRFSFIGFLVGVFFGVALH